MTRKWEIRSIVSAFALVVLAFSLFGILFAEERKRVGGRADRFDELFSRILMSDAARRRYLENLEADREKLRGQMERSESGYEDLLERQPDLVEAGRQEVTTTVEEVVPVQVPVTTRSTKTS